MIAERFLSCLAAADHQQAPYDHWLLGGCLPQEVLDNIVTLPFAPPGGLLQNLRMAQGRFEVY